MTVKQKQVLYRIIAAMILLVAVAIYCASIKTNLYVQATLYLIPYLVIGYDILKKAGRGILNRQMFDENFLMAVDRKSTRLNSSHITRSRMPSSA